MSVRAVFIALFFVLSPHVIAGNGHYCDTCTRDKHGHILRSSSAKSEFKRIHPCPTTGRKSGPCGGYEIDHVTPLWQGGADSIENMQWLSVKAHRSKTKAEAKYRRE